MQITPDIFQVGGSGFSSSNDAAVYLFRSENDALLIDSGCGQSVAKIIDNIRKTGTELSLVRQLLLTHCHYDHAGGADEIRKELGLKIIAHKEDAVFLESGSSTVTAADWYGSILTAFSIDIKLTQNHEIITIGQEPLDIFHIPGHSPGSIAVLAKSEGQKVLFGQDVHGPLHPTLMSDREQYNRSLKFLISLEADILCEGHFGVIRGRTEVRSFIEQYL